MCGNLQSVPTLGRDCRCCCALLGEILGSFDQSIELARLAHAQFHTIPEMYT